MRARSRSVRTDYVVIKAVPSPGSGAVTIPNGAIWRTTGRGLLSLIERGLRCIEPWTARADRQFDGIRTAGKSPTTLGRMESYKFQQLRDQNYVEYLSRCKPVQCSLLGHSEGPISWRIGATPKVSRLTVGSSRNGYGMAFTVDLENVQHLGLSQYGGG